MDRGLKAWLRSSESKKRIEFVSASIAIVLTALTLKDPLAADSAAHSKDSRLVAFSPLGTPDKARFTPDSHVFEVPRNTEQGQRERSQRDSVRGETASFSCPPNADPLSQIFVLPENPTAKRPVRVLGIARHQTDRLELAITSETQGRLAASRTEAWGFSPRVAGAEFSQIEPGTYRVGLLRGDSPEALACQTLKVAKSEGQARPLAASFRGAWPVRRDWSPSMEDLYAAFVSHLFYVAPGSQKGWRPLHQATRDPYRNILFGVLGLDEDASSSHSSVKIEPDCADAPFQLRAYFSWKMGLPFMINRCTRGSSDKGPRCNETWDNTVSAFDGVADPVERFNRFITKYVGWKVHAGNARTLPDSNTSDLYSVALDRWTIRPGVVFVDTGGHLILVSQWEPQRESAIGVLYGVDAHPDLTVTHKAFASGTFVFNHRVPTGGFKAFRPIVRGAKGELRFLSNAEINMAGDYLPQSAEQAQMATNDHFYDRVLDLLNPRPMDPKDVMLGKIAILHSAMQERVQAVQIGVDYMKKNGWAVMPMPDGPAIFETNGPWEDFSTPARDMRCFLAIDDVMNFPDRVVRDLSRYAVDPNVRKDKLREELILLRDRELAAHNIEYTRYDGRIWNLSLADIVARQKDLELAYNPNDCIETRWAAPKGAPERETCKHQAPASQHKKMQQLRYWFATRHRPDQQS